MNNEDYNISTSDSSEIQALPPAVERVIPALRRAGQLSFWVQIILGVVAALIFLFTIPIAASDEPGAAQINPGRGPGIFFAVTGLVALGISIYWTLRYGQLAKRLGIADSTLRPTRAETVRAIEIGSIVNLVGMLFNLLAAETITGILLAKALRSEGVAFSPAALNQLIQPIDIFVVLGNTHTLFAHFIGLTTSLWLLRWVVKSKS
ncbi:hypothetical protein CKA32_000358 [Geitlerinema sp. FC II]|uniref:DUF3611 family protein n=1 Tax=Baaleninema simplex TaxID=2862350 RepID=UPI00034BDFE0|nr:DUF3611 family protein [Baaleninema simplex]PPT05800.1 hypothetical protein CKA32_000358 [Geitlerinema sp. FC II]